MILRKKKKKKKTRLFQGGVNFYQFNYQQ